MPESGAIERTRDAMDAWLRMDLPADFDQLRADMRHILACIPDTHQRPAPPVIGEGVHFRTREDATVPCHIPLPLCDCYNITTPATIRIRVEHTNHFHGAHNRLTVHCDVCDNRWAWEPTWDADKVQQFAADHHHAHQEPPC